MFVTSNFNSLATSVSGPFPYLKYQPLAAYTYCFNIRYTSNYKYTLFIFTSILSSLPNPLRDCNRFLITSIFKIYINSTQELIKDTSMASATTISSSEPTKVHTSNISSIKAFAESNGTSLIPSNYHSLTEHGDIIDVADEIAASIPIIDFSLLTSDDPQIHTKAVHELAKACSEWGLFMVTFPFYLVVFSNDT